MTWKPHRLLYRLALPFSWRSSRDLKVYSISKWAFGAICLLILLLPVSRHWKILTTGERTSGTVSGYTLRVVEEVMTEQKLAHASEITFEANGKHYKTYGPNDYEYAEGRLLTVFYRPEDPSKNIVATFSGFYLSNYTVLPIVLLIFWYAFYLSFNNYRKRRKSPRGKAQQQLRD